MNQLRYLQPAKKWTQALPLGNGKTGVMIFGGADQERLSFNDTALWSGYPKDQDNPQSLENLQKVRQLIFEEKYQKAEKLTRQKLSGHYSESFMPLGDLTIKINSSKNNLPYQRELDLNSAVHTVTCNGITREAFVSYPDKIAVYKMKSSNPFSVVISATTKLKGKTVIENGLEIVGQAPDYVAPNYLRTQIKPIRYGQKKGMCFCLRCEADTDGKIIYGKRKLIIQEATQIVLYITTETGFLGYDQMPAKEYSYAQGKARATLNRVAKNYETIKSRHIADYQQIFFRQSLNLFAQSDLPTDELVALAKKGEVKTALIQLFYHYGKYLAISASRSGGQAMNLQGLWNQSVRPAWSSNYTANINAQMNYWGISSCNMPECLPPYVKMIREIMQKGKKTAKVNYGCAGFCCNHNTDIWRKTAPVRGQTAYMFAPLCGAWFANELFEHLRYGDLEAYRDQMQEIVTEAVLFAKDYLISHKGYYVTCPSASPEASFFKNGQRCSLDYASAFEIGIIRQLFQNFLSFAQENALKEEIRKIVKKLYPFSKGQTGINEWHEDFSITEKGHRHFSPLYAFYPARVIGYYQNPEETLWVKALFHYRLEHITRHVGWSAAWAICLSARLHEPETALSVIEKMIEHSVFSNLFDVHPPAIFQIDGNFGFVAGVNEMLVSIENDVIEFLPACPKQWSQGEVKGMKVSGGYEVSFAWKDGEVTDLSVCGKTPKIRNRNLAQNLKLGDCELVL